MVTSLRATALVTPILRGVIALDYSMLNSDILAALQTDPVTCAHLDGPLPPLNSDSFLQLDDCIYVPNIGTLRLHVMQYSHNHPVSGHFSVNKTLQIIQRNYTWPAVRTLVKYYVKSCNPCM